MIWDAIVASGCKVLVITQNLSSAYLNNADYILRCGLSNRDDVGKYSAMMMTDYMVMLYLKKYGKK
jgi:fructoselysine-6-P-deglycase FrlB-like protein